MKSSVMKKRKAINDFITPIAKHKASTNPKNRVECHGKEEADCVSAQKTSVPGLTIQHDFVNHNEETTIIDFLNDPSKCTWRTDLGRRTMHFGSTYCLMQPKSNASSQAKPQILQAPSMPVEFDWLIQCMVNARIFQDDQRPQYCIFNEYIGNPGISAHTENFQFGEPVVGLSLLSACPIRFHDLTEPYDGSVRSGKAGKASKTGKVLDVVIPKRSLLVMRSESRWKWQHEIVRSVKGRGARWKRVSLTFRYKPDDKP